MYWGVDSRDMYYYHTDVGAARTLNEQWSVGLYYRSVQFQQNNAWSHEDRPHLDFVLRNKWADLSVQNRARFEYRMRQDMDDFMRYRHRLQLQHPLQVAGCALTPYVSEELFIDTDQGDFNEFRTAAGLKKKLGPSFEADLYYMWQTVDKSRQWQDTHIAGAMGGFTF